MLEIIDLFRDKGTLDELGFGSIRDAFSDYFFPGITTIQTRARYFLFVPWIHIRIEREHDSYALFESRARADQARLVNALLRGGEGEAQGVIGIQAGERLQRTPADVYWGGLRRLGIWRFRGSLAQYYSSSRSRARIPVPFRSDDGELVDRPESSGWDPELPLAPNDLLEQTTLSLTAVEADYLADRIRLAAPGSLLSIYVNDESHLQNIDAPWLHPQLSQLPSPLRAELDQAHSFSVISYGATLLYNIMLSEKANQAGLPSAAGMEDLLDQMNGWAASIETRRSLYKWKLSDLWGTVLGKGHQISHPTRLFVETIVSAVQPDPAQLLRNERARRAIELRERTLKGGLARLSNRHALERLAGPVGLARQTYRWPQVRRILTDIRDGRQAAKAA
jgi:hypothetical protein